jgi:hypothetical protein
MWSQVMFRRRKMSGRSTSLVVVFLFVLLVYNAFKLLLGDPMAPRPMMGNGSGTAQYGIVTVRGSASTAVVLPMLFVSLVGIVLGLKIYMRTRSSPGESNRKLWFATVACLVLGLAMLCVCLIQRMNSSMVEAG